MKYKGNPSLTTVVLHHTAVSRRNQPLQLDPVNNHHRDKWNGQSELGYYVGYNFFCEPTGKRTQCRKIGEETIAQIGNNCANPPHDCKMVSYCMAGDFRVEKPTSHQIADFKAFVAELREIYPRVVIKQHKDVAANRTCAELDPVEIASWFKKDSKDEEIAKLKQQVQQLIGLVTVLLKLINK